MESQASFQIGTQLAGVTTCSSSRTWFNAAGKGRKDKAFLAAPKLIGKISPLFAGEYFVAAELPGGGHIASISVRNMRGFEIVAASRLASRSIATACKTNQAPRRIRYGMRKVKSLSQMPIVKYWLRLTELSSVPVARPFRAELSQVSTHGRPSGSGRLGPAIRTGPFRRTDQPRGHPKTANGHCGASFALELCCRLGERLCGEALLGGHVRDRPFKLILSFLSTQPF